jgi:hypothetical protein
MFEHNKLYGSFHGKQNVLSNKIVIRIVYKIRYVQIIDWQIFFHKKSIMFYESGYANIRWYCCVVSLIRQIPQGANAILEKWDSSKHEEKLMKYLSICLNVKQHWEKIARCEKHGKLKIQICKW